jgi:hypothetical protein
VCFIRLKDSSISSPPYLTSDFNENILRVNIIQNKNIVSKQAKRVPKAVNTITIIIVNIYNTCYLA